MIISTTSLNSTGKLLLKARVLVPIYASRVQLYASKYQWIKKCGPSCVVFTKYLHFHVSRIQYKKKRVVERKTMASFSRSLHFDFYFMHAYQRTNRIYAHWIFMQEWKITFVYRLYVSFQIQILSYEILNYMMKFY